MIKHNNQYQDMGKDGKGNIQNNRLLHVYDAVAPTVYDDIDDQGAYVQNNPDTHNYGYDKIGNLISDKQEEIAEIEWNVQGKVTKIKRTAGSQKSDLVFKYDAMGNRISKTEKQKNSLPDLITYYVRDAQGNVMAVYEKQNYGIAIAGVIVAADVFSLKEQHIYGSSRLGMRQANTTMATFVINSGDVIQASFTNKSSRELGEKNFELSNHLGNVLAVVTDKRLANNEPDVLSTSDFYPFGMTMPGRKMSADSYRFGFGGHEKDDEVKGNGNHISFEGYGYDPRLGRRWNIDPLATEYPWQSPFLSSDNNPIFFNDPNGQNAVGRIKGNTITVSAVIYVVNAGENKINISEAQKAINNYWDKNFKYKDENGKIYNVKFSITVKNLDVSYEGLTNNSISSEDANIVYPQDESFNNGRSNVAENMFGRWIANKTDKTYGHEMGHFLGLADQYVDVKFDAGNLDFYGMNGKIQSWNYDSTTPDELMGATEKGNSVEKKVTQKDIDVIAGFILKNQKDGKTVINKKTLPTGGLAAPSEKDKENMQKKVQGTPWEIQERQ